jgi:hypothetical protein
MREIISGAIREAIREALITALDTAPIFALITALTHLIDGRVVDDDLPVDERLRAEAAGTLLCGPGGARRPVPAQ